MHPTTFILLILACCSAGNCEVAAPEVMEAFRNLLPYCRIGEDQGGAGVYFAPFAAWKLGDLTPTGEKETFLDIFLEEMIGGFMTDAGRNGEGVTLIFDCAGLDMNYLLGSDGALEAIMKFGAKQTEFARAIKTFYIINNELSSGLFATLWSPFMGDLASRVKFYGSNREEWEPQLLGSIPRNVLLQSHGGTNPMPEKCDRKELKGTFIFPTAKTISSAVLFISQRQLQLLSV